MSLSNPFFSILIPSYNRPEYLRSCIESILANAFSDYEIIISDDASPRADEIKKCIEPFLKDGKVRFYSQLSNLREAGNKNFLSNQSKGRFSFFIGDDDRLYPDSLDRLRRFIEQHPDYGLYAFGYKVIDEHNRFYYSRRAPRALEVSQVNERCLKSAVECNLFPFWLFHPATFCCVSSLQRQIRYNEAVGTGEDILFLIDFLNLGEKMMIIPDILFDWRRVTRRTRLGQINQSLVGHNNLIARKKIFDHLTSRLDLNPFLNPFVHSDEFRQRFLIDAIIAERLTRHPEWKAFVGESAGHVARGRLFGQGRRVLEFTRLFGWAGIVEVAKVFVQRMTYGIRCVWAEMTKR